MLKTKQFGYLISYGRRTFSARLFSTYLPDYNRFLKNEEYMEAFEVIEPFAKAGDCVAERCLGKLYLKAPVKEIKFKSLTDSAEKLNAEDVIEHIKARMKQNIDEIFAFKRNVKKELSAVDSNNFYGSHFEGMKWLHKSAKKSDVKAQLLFSKQVVLETHRFSKSHFKDAEKFLEKLSVSKTKYQNEAIYLLGLLSYDGCKEFSYEQNKTQAFNLFSKSKKHSKSNLMRVHMFLYDEVKKKDTEGRTVIREFIRFVLKGKDGLAKVYFIKYISDLIINIKSKDKNFNKHTESLHRILAYLSEYGVNLSRGDLHNFLPLMKKLTEEAIKLKEPEAYLFKTLLLVKEKEMQEIENICHKEMNYLYDLAFKAGKSEAYLQKAIFLFENINTPSEYVECFRAYEETAYMGCFSAYRDIAEFYARERFLFSDSSKYTELGVPVCKNTRKAILSFVEGLESENIP